MLHMVSKNTAAVAQKSWLHRLYCSVWLFPAVLLSLLLLLTALRISGTSIGMYNEILYGNTQKDPDLLAGQPQPIRSDEWLFVTQMTIAQHAEGYPLVNHNIGSGRDMSVVGNAPYKDWSSLFRPENFAFFVMPLEFAFAFKWWLLLFLAITGGYFVALRFAPKQRLFAAMFGTAVGCSPFLFWWYQTVTFAPIYLGFFIILIGMRIIKDEGVPFLGRFNPACSSAALVLALAYLLTCFGLVLYPPFQIPVAIVVASLLAAVFVQMLADKEVAVRVLAKRLGVLIAGAMLAGILVAIFVYTRSDVVKLVEHTAYPGARTVASGGAPVSDVLGSYLMPQLEHTARATHYFNNQSEASNFLLFLPFLLIPGFVFLLYEFRRLRRLNWQLLAMQLAGVLFLADLYLPGLGIIGKVTFLDKVPHQRLLIGLGFSGALQLLCLFEAVARLKISFKKLFLPAAVYSAICFCVLVWFGLYTRAHYPLFLHSLPFMCGLALLFCLIMFFAMTGRRIATAAVFVLFSIGSVFGVHPLYVGLGLGVNNKVISAIDQVSRPGSTWAVLDNLVFENFPTIAGRDSISGVQLYPDMSFWKQADANPADAPIYNRYAHVLFTENLPAGTNLDLLQPDLFEARFGCTPFVEQHVQYALVIHTLNDACVRQVGVVHYPQVTFYLYRVN